MDPSTSISHSRKRLQDDDDDDLTCSEGEAEHNPIIVNKSAVSTHVITTESSQYSCSDVAAREHTTVPTASTSVDTTGDRLSRPLAHTDTKSVSIQSTENAGRISLSRKAKVAKSSGASKSGRRTPVSGTQRLHITLKAKPIRTATDCGPETSLIPTENQPNMPIIGPSSLSTQNPTAHVVDLTGGGASIAHIGEEGYSAIHLPRPVSIHPKILGGMEDILRWRSTPFTLVQIEDDLSCPRLVVNPNTPLCQVLSPSIYPLDIALLQIHERGGNGYPLPYEASQVLILCNAINPCCSLISTEPVNDHSLIQNISTRLK